MTEDEKRKAIENGRAIEMLLTNQTVLNWFEYEKTSLLHEMVNAEIGDDEKRKNCAIAFRVLDKLFGEMKTAVSRANHLAATGDDEVSA